MEFQVLHKREMKPEGCTFCFSNYRSNMLAKGGITIVLENLTSWFLDSLEECDFFEKKIGKSFCSKQDNYNKKEGVKIASSRLKNTKLFVDKIVKISENVKTVTLRDKLYNSYTFRVDTRKENARFLSYTHNKQNIRG